MCVDGKHGKEIGILTEIGFVRIRKSRRCELQIREMKINLDNLKLIKQWTGKSTPKFRS